MTYTLRLPEVGETVTEGTIEKWLKAPGDEIRKYEPIVEINTDKVNVELPSPVSGTVAEILVQEGETVPIGAELCRIDEVAGETPAEITPPTAAETQKPSDKVEPATVAATPSDIDLPRDGRGNGHETPERGPNRATPRVRKVAAELGVDLGQISGTGPRGRIIETDVRNFADSGGTLTAMATPSPGSRFPADRASAPTPQATGEDETVAVSGIRRTIAQRMSQSAFTAPHAWLVVEADVTELVRLRASRKEAFRVRNGVDLTYLPFAAHAVSQALLDHPYLNASWAEDKIILKREVNLGIAVATERGLLVPVVHAADRLSVTGLALAMADLGAKARDNKLQLDDVQGGTFTLDNTGAFGSIVSMPIVNLGQAAIISLEAIRKEPRVVGDDAIAVRSVVNLCLSFDHRILDGNQAGAFLGDVKSRLEAFGPETGLD
ncbi:MAG TPA: dihydrolipoamide acetyltransferase family protein [Dehalococcoidia bacterium]|nr:dihydrolipoamide acetyltransferase family protein [Dehalococcoidia bacterium]